MVDRDIAPRLVKMPKLRFYGSGLACWLPGIRNAGQLNRHPLRGAILESRVVAEIAKHRANAGERAGLFYYRDHNGVEADLLVESANDLLSPARRSALLR